MTTTIETEISLAKQLAVQLVRASDELAAAAELTRSNGYDPESIVVAPTGQWFNLGAIARNAEDDAEVVEQLASALSEHGSQCLVKIGQSWNAGEWLRATAAPTGQVTPTSAKLLEGDTT